MFSVEVKAIGGWTIHSEHESYRDAVDQADMVHGRIFGECDECGAKLNADDMADNVIENDEQDGNSFWCDACRKIKL